mgnify:FL=1
MAVAGKGISGRGCGWTTMFIRGMMSSPEALDTLCVTLYPCNHQADNVIVVHFCKDGLHWSEIVPYTVSQLAGTDSVLRIFCRLCGNLRESTKQIN